MAFQTLSIILLSCHKHWLFSEQSLVLTSGVSEKKNTGITRQMPWNWFFSRKILIILVTIWFLMKAYLLLLEKKLWQRLGSSRMFNAQQKLDTHTPKKVRRMYTLYRSEYLWLDLSFNWRKPLRLQLSRDPFKRRSIQNAKAHLFESALKQCLFCETVPTLFLCMPFLRLLCFISISIQWRYAM